MTQPIHFCNVFEETQTTDLKEYMLPYVQCSVVYKSQELEAVQVLISRWVAKQSVVCSHNGLLLGSKKEGNLTLWDSVDGPGEHYAKWNKPVREKQTPYEFTHMCIVVNKWTKSKQTYR